MRTGMVVSLLLVVQAASMVSSEPAGSAFQSEEGLIAYGTRRDGAPDIFWTTWDGDEPHRLTVDPGYDASAAWAPDGSRIAFITTRDGGPAEIYTVRADGTDPRRVTFTPDVTETSPSWSPDGQRIAFEVYDDERREVWTMAADGTDRVRVTTGDLDSMPAWSPDGDRLVFARGLLWTYTGEKLADLWLLDLATGVETQLTDSSEADLLPDWSPDGTQLAFERDRDVWVFDVATGEERNLTADRESSAGSPAWAPSGRWMVMVSYAGRPVSDLFLLNPESGAVQQVTDTLTRDEWSPDWQPLGVAPLPIPDPPARPVAASPSFTG